MRAELTTNYLNHKVQIWKFGLFIHTISVSVYLEGKLTASGFLFLFWIAQACHASTAVLHMHKEDEGTREYLDKLDSMHKVVLAAPDLESLTKLATVLSERQISYKLWIEQPENIPTCIAIKPYPRNEVKGLVQHLKLFS